MKSVMQHNFATAPSIEAPRSQFDLSHGHKTTLDAGVLVPYNILDVIPGDTISLDTTAFLRMSTPQFPFFDNVNIDIHHFFVPLRLVWDNARKFFGEQVNPTDSIDYTIPQFNSFTPAEGSLSDYLGLPIGNAMTVNSIYHRGYNLVWNEFFRDQNLQNSVTVDTDDGPDDIADYVLLKRGKRHDYFTSCLPWPQKGDAVTLPLGTQAPVSGIASNSQTYTGTNLPVYETGGTASTTYNPWQVDSANNFVMRGTATTSGFPDIYADLTNATAATINDLREAFQIQKLLERDARAGTRYSELVKNHFGVNFYDVTYRPEFLGGGTSTLNATPVPTTGSLADAGDLGAFASSATTNNGFTKSFVEHGFIISLISTRADLNYQQGVPRHFLKQTRYDTYFPSLAHLGEQEITNAELYYQGTSADDDIFGYNERYSEYRFCPSKISGRFRSTSATPLDAWHLAQEFTSLPTLGPTFIEESPPMDRILQVTTEPDFIMDSYTRIKAARPMPVYGTPGMIDHF